MTKDVIFFESADQFRSWLETNHDKEEVLWVGLYKVKSGKPSMRWEESVRAALCFGWIDGLRKSIDEESYKIRFTPRRSDSHWSNKNIAMAEELIESGQMRPPGQAAYKQREKSNSAKASYEQDSVALKEAYREKLKSNEKAWTFFQDLAPGYTQTSVHWVMSAKQEKTRQRRLNILIESCEEGKKIPLLRR
ncbi:YdeI/OmpD-associated family protein [Fodinibius sp. Rm-B-1B1-1]|uniref:YdeI/OmpD-associated family protein n=1 Tax=Fodinibius alkaliphilus TaxID=3140241 RepID=UPI00315A00FF